MVEKAIIHCVQQGRLDMLLVRNLDKLGEWEHFMDERMQLIVGSNTLIKPVAQLVKCDMEKVNS